MQPMWFQLIVIALTLLLLLSTVSFLTALLSILRRLRRLRNPPQYPVRYQPRSILERRIRARNAADNAEAAAPAANHVVSTISASQQAEIHIAPPPHELPFTPQPGKENIQRIIDHLTLNDDSPQTSSV